jgi:UDP-3-O-[3-hydroxymyristoyl] glucosamine N-acyltransferase
MPQNERISLSLAEIAARLGGDVLGAPETQVTQVASLSSAQAGQIAFLSNPKYRTQLVDTAASAVIIAPGFAAETPLPRIVTANPYAYYARLAAMLNAPPKISPSVAESVVSASVIPDSAFIGPGVVIGKEVVLGSQVVIQAGCVIGDGVRIGDDALLYPNVTIYPGCRIGQRTVIHSGAVIGADGFGFAPDGDTWVKIPQIGGVQIGNDVEIGANTTVDRGALDDTQIGDGCKLDNQIQIGHNCIIGKNTVISGCTAIAGSVRIGEHCMIGGAAMITGHLSIASGAVISAGTFIAKSIHKPGQYTSVFPVEPHDRWLQNAAQIRHLAKLADRVASLEKQLKERNPKD